MKRAVLLFGVLVMMSFIGVAQGAQWTVWRVPSADSFPGKLVWMVDDSLFVSLYSPQALARFEPAANRLIIWKLDVAPSEFIWTNSGLLFIARRAASVGWLQPDANYVQYWSLPSPEGEEPILAVNSSFGGGAENMWYLDWGLGRLGLFEPSALTIPHEVGDPPQVMNVPKTSSEATPYSETVEPDVKTGSGGLVQQTYSLKPVVTPQFREWNISTVNPPPYALIEDNASGVWMPNPAAGTLICLNPGDSSVTEYWLPDNLVITSLSLSSDGSHIWFLVMDSATTAKIGVLRTEHDRVTTWSIPGGEMIDPVSLICVDDEFWFCDRGESAVYRFVPETGAFTRWYTGGDDAPLYIVPGKPGEFWVSWERTGKIARLTLPPSQDSSDTEL